MQRATVERSLTTIVVLHDLNAAARSADTVAVISSGQLAALGPPESTITPALVGSVFEVRAESVRLSDSRLHLAVTHSLKSDVPRN